MITNRSYVIIWPERGRVLSGVYPGYFFMEYTFPSATTFGLDDAKERSAQFSQTPTQIITLDEFETLRMLAAL